MNQCFARFKNVKNFIQPFSNLNNSFCRYKYIACYTKPSVSQRNPKAPGSHFTLYQLRTVFSSNLKKSDGKPIENSGENIKLPVDDEEFQNVLKDFAKDFDVSGDNEKILDDIKKSLDEHDTNGKVTSESSPLPDARSSSNIKFSAHTSIEDKYKKFSDEDTVVIPSSEDLAINAYSEEVMSYHIDQDTEFEDALAPVKRGITGVFDIEELVEALRKEKMMDIAVISVPKDLHYSDYLCLVTAKSLRHSDAVAEHLLKLYKRKKNLKDPFIVFEGEKKSNWKALDMGNIVLHIFTEETRTYYDIESLWLFDSQYDSGGTLQPDPLFDAIEEQMAFFNSLQQDLPKEPSPKEGT